MIIVNHVNVVSHYIQLNVSSTQYPLTKLHISQNHSNTAPHECVMKGSLSSKESNELTVWALPRTLEGARASKGP